MKPRLAVALFAAAFAWSSAAAAQHKMTTPIAAGVATPDRLETSIGTLTMTDGNPDAATAQKIYDNLDRSRALQAYLLGIPIVNQAGMRGSLRQFGPDNQTRSMLQTDQSAPSVSSQDCGIKVNGDGSVDVYFGPEAPAGMESNWIQTIPGKGWFMILRLYGPLEPWFNQTWRPGEIELQG